MSRLEASALEVAVALNKFSSALNEVYRDRVKTLEQNGDLFPVRNAQFDLQQRMSDLVGSGRFTSAQARALSAAHQSWKPPVEDSKDA